MNINYNKNLEVRYTPDVLVIGAGPSGLSAAVMCARELGAEGSVMLIEQSGSPGGAGVLAMVSEIMNFDDGEHFLAAGFGTDIHNALFGECSYTREWKNIKPEPMKRTYDNLLTESGVKVLYYTRVTDAVTDGDGKVSHAVVSDPSGTYAIAAKHFIDATGSGFFCALSGAEYEYGDAEGRPMSATLCSLWGGVDFDRLGEQWKGLSKAFADGVLTQYDMLLPGIKANFPEVGVGGGNVGHTFGTDDRSAESLSEALVFARRSLAEYENYYKHYVEGCENAELLRTADYLGVRESRRIKCRFMLTSRYYNAPEPFDDEIGRYSYPIDIHPMTADEQGMKDFDENVSRCHEKGESYSIPYRSLLPEGFSNLFVVGRSIGADHDMIASVRVVPGCYITGQAAGVAAALCTKANVSAPDVNINDLQNALKRHGAYLTI